MGCSLVGFFQTACNNNLKQCLKEQSFLAGKAQCFVDYGKCLINKGSVTEALMDASNDGEPGRHPYVVSSINLCTRKLPMGYFSFVSLMEGGGVGILPHLSSLPHVIISQSITISGIKLIFMACKTPNLFTIFRSPK